MQRNVGCGTEAVHELCSSDLRSGVMTSVQNIDFLPMQSGFRFEAVM